jgi:hypothetical protein
MQPKNRLGVPRRTLHTVRARFDLFSAGDSDDAALLSQEARTVGNDDRSLRETLLGDRDRQNVVAQRAYHPPHLRWRRGRGELGHASIRRKRAYQTLRIPESVMLRVYQRIRKTG